MRITSIEATLVEPIQLLKISNLTDVVVFAGPNGVGKSRLINALISKFQNPASSPNIRLVIEATNSTERNDWKKNQLDTTIASDTQLLTGTLHKNRFRREWSSSVIHFESDRSIQRIDPFQFSFDALDPWSEAISWNMTFGGLRARFQDTLHSLFRKVHSHEKAIARKAIELHKSGAASMPLDFSDPLKAFKDAFEQLLAPKRLLDPDPKDQQLYYEHVGKKFRLDSLSSGEREVINIVFDFILRTSSNCVIFFDEPELHLHPELSYKLLQALRSAGEANQFIFCTHSADIITASLDHTVVFLSPPRIDPSGEPENQAIRVQEDDSTNQALRLLGQSVGIISLGRRIVLVEGRSSSLDKQTYGFLLKHRHPNLVLVATGGKDEVHGFAHIFDRVLSRTLWGVEFFMLCDRDAAAIADITRLEAESKGRLRFLKRYHLENYFLDSSMLATLFDETEPPDSWLRTPGAIEARLREIAATKLSYATALITSADIRRKVGNVSVMPKAAHNKSVDELVALFNQKVAEELTRTSAILQPREIETSLRNTFADLDAAIREPSSKWLTVIPGKPVLAQFAAVANIDLGRLKLAYLNRVTRTNAPIFEDILQIFSDFAIYA